jgi:hypothetical protein
MGGNRVGGESTLGELVAEGAFLVEDSHLSITRKAAYMNNSYSDRLKYVHREPFGHDKCKFGSTHITALMIKTTNGEKKHA